MNYAALRTAVRTRLGNPSSDNFYSDTVLGDLVNEALQVISTEHDWPWLEVKTTFNTTGGTQTVSVPADWIRTKAIYRTGFEALEWITRQEMDGITAQAQPQYYTVAEDKIYLGPIPDSAYTFNHQYIKTETALAADGDTPAMPSIFHYSIVAYATYLAHHRGREEDRAQIALRAYDSWLQRMRHHRRRTAGPLRPRVRPGSWL